MELPWEWSPLTVSMSRFPVQSCILSWAIVSHSEEQHHRVKTILNVVESDFYLLYLKDNPFIITTEDLVKCPGSRPHFKCT